jgi:2-oxoglutarate dehydrogenase E2 component (dihydrolipoamide succinyltransferase)
MATTVHMPQLGETVTEGTVLSWAKAVGDTVSVDEVLLEISTDKVDTEVPSPVSGVVLELLVGEGDTVDVGAPLAIIGEAGEETAAAPEAPGAEAAAVAAAAPTEPAFEAPAVSEPAPPAPPAAPAAASDSITVAMPQLGETVTEGTVLSWAKAVGDTVAVDEVLLEISTDKVDTEVPSPAAGVVLEILAGEGDTVEVGAPLVIIGSAGAVPETGAPPPAPAADVEPAPGEPPVREPAAEEVTPAVAAVAVTGGPRHSVVSPVVRRMAAKNNVDLSLVPGSGDGGRVTRKDIEAYIASGAGLSAKVTFEETAPPAPAATPPPADPAPAAPAPAPAPAAPAPAPAAPAPAPAAPAPVPAAPAPAPAAPAPVVTPPAMSGSEVREMPRLRRAIATNMVRSKQTAAHVWTAIEVDYTAVERVRQAHKARFKDEEGFSLTYLPFVSRATIDALREYPVVNSSFDLEQGTQTFHHAVNLGIAVDLNQEGLLVVTVPGADGLRMRGIARSIREKAAKAHAGKLEPADISGSTFTITNPGPFGSLMTAAIINLPNVAILSTDTVVKRPVVVSSADGTDTIAIRNMGNLGFTWDHRAFDGSTAVLFLNRIKHNLENWDWEQELL